MIGLPFKKTILAALLVLVGGTGAYLVIRGRREPPPPVDPLPELVYGRIVEAIAAAVEIPKGTERILVAPIPGDGQEKLRSRIQNRLGDRTYVEVITEEEGTVQPTTGETLAQLYERGRAWLLSVPAMTAPIIGATATVYDIPSASLSDAGTYDCMATNWGGPVTSNAITLDVNDAPPAFTLQPVSVQA